MIPYLEVTKVLFVHYNVLNGYYEKIQEFCLYLSLRHHLSDLKVHSKVIDNF